jgi:hypothetical protein
MEGPGAYEATSGDLQTIISPGKLQIWQWHEAMDHGSGKHIESRARKQYISVPRFNASRKSIVVTLIVAGSKLKRFDNCL